MVVVAVIIIGRKRSCPPRIMASRRTSPLFSVSVDMIDQNNAIIHHNTKKHEKAVFGIAVHSDLKRVETERDADKCKENAEHNGERMDVGFKERGP